MPETAERAASVSPIVTHISESIRKRITSGELPAGMRLPSERAIGLEFGVSRTMVRMALHALQQDGLLDRTNGCRPIVSVSYSNEAAAENIDRQNVGIWISGGPADVGAYSVLQGAQQLFGFDEYRLVVASRCADSYEESLREEARFLKVAARDADIDGVLVWYLGGETNLRWLNAVRESGKPIVFVDRKPPAKFAADFVGIDNRKCADQVVSHFISCGHTCIAHITNRECACTVTDRLKGYRDALGRHHVELSPDLVYMGPFNEPEIDVYHDIARKMLTRSPRPTAVFAVNDYAAMCLRAALRDIDADAASDIAIAGFDDLERWRPGPATLTTVRQPFEQMGLEAARLLIERMKNPDHGAYVSVIMDAPLVVRSLGVSLTDRN